MKITDAMLKSIMPHAPASVRAAKLPLLNRTAFHYQITTRNRVCSWLATLAVESGEFRYSEEIASGAEYENREDLGNTQPGDGRKFKGHGDIQGTGRDVHTEYTKYLRASGHLPFEDFVQNPQLLALSPYSEDFAGWFVNEYKHLQSFADAGNFLRYEIGVNGRNKSGYPNNWVERQSYYRRALAVIPDGWALDEAPDPAEVVTTPEQRVAIADKSQYPDYNVVTGEADPAAVPVEEPQPEVASVEDPAPVIAVPPGATEVIQTQGPAPKPWIDRTLEKLEPWQKRAANASDMRSSFGQLIPASGMSGSSKLITFTGFLKTGLFLALGFVYEHWLWVLAAVVFGATLWYVTRSKDRNASYNSASTTPAPSQQSQTVVIPEASK